MRPSSLILSPPLLAALAAAAAALGGCGKVQPLLFDASSGDDASGIDAATDGIVKVTVLDISGNNAPEANVPVVFINPDGTVAAKTASDKDGHAQATVHIGASVTAIWLQNTSYQVITMPD